MMIVETDFFSILPMWQTKEMWGNSDVKRVSSLKFYDGISHLGGNDMRVYDLSISLPKFFLCIKNSISVGCISGHLINNTIRARGIFVHKEHRKQGIAEALLKHLIDHYQQNRPESFIWALAGPNSMRVHFKCGFNQITPQYNEDLPDGNKTAHNNCYMRLNI